MIRQKTYCLDTSTCPGVDYCGARAHWKLADGRVRHNRLTDNSSPIALLRVHHVAYSSQGGFLSEYLDLRSRRRMTWLVN